VQINDDFYVSWLVPVGTVQIYRQAANLFDVLLLLGKLDA
jgi:hypothetical protein